ncbi:acyltransferase family protein [uncultured Roseovarius sp.]|uniref:acyltransferase family protein n=1 Tax=uncultured Roseovarius sp. TaxID=293344 RepID=UPI0025976337|nr:acyltransferase family protein [uncultured Roseovarius sp.]
MQYRKDIDGLRAVAVSVIVLFHFGVSSLSGGYIGVDVFFVISGFLITRLIHEDIKRGRFSFGAFYMRRLRRIGPSLLATLALTLLAGYFILSPAHYEDLGLATQAAVLSLSNILFWTQSGYFDTEAIYKPLLHTWSLAVEEQFYFVWPLVLVLLLKVTSLARTLAILAVVSVITLAAAEYMLGRDPSGAFFLPVFRVYEFGFGAALALTGRIARPGAGAHFSSLAGLALIMGGSLAFTEHQRFPGLAALVPCLGASLLIYAGPQAILNRVLTLRPIRYIGLISYSLYLVHWPMLVYFAYYHGIPDSPAEIAMLSLAAVALGALFYHFIETPFRRKTPTGFRISGKQLGVSAFVWALAITLTSGKIDEKHGYPDRLSGEMRALQERVAAAGIGRQEAIRLTTCHFTPDTAERLAGDLSGCLPDRAENAIVVLGDSHAADIWAGLSRAYPDRAVVQFTGAGCDRGRDPGEAGLIDHAHCDSLQEISARWISDNKTDVAAVIYSQRAASMMLGDPVTDSASLASDLQRLDALEADLSRVAGQGVPVLFWGPRPEFHPSLDVATGTFPTLEALLAIYGEADMTPYRQLDDTLAARFADSPVTYFSSFVPLCTPECPLLIDGGEPAITDYAHWSPAGARLAISRIVTGTPVLEDLLGSPDVASTSQ